MEELIRKHSHAKQLTVVSSDQRIKKCAQTRRARTMGAEQFLDRLENRLAEKESSGFSVEDRFGTHGDEHQMGEQEISFWMDEFGIE